MNRRVLASSEGNDGSTQLWAVVAAVVLLGCCACGSDPDEAQDEDPAQGGGPAEAGSSAGGFGAGGTAATGGSAGSGGSPDELPLFSFFVTTLCGQ